MGGLFEVKEMFDTKVTHPEEKIAMLRSAPCMLAVTTSKLAKIAAVESSDSFHLRLHSHNLPTRYPDINQEIEIKYSRLGSVRNKTGKERSSDPMKSRAESSVETPGGTIPLGSLTPQQLEKLQADLQREVELISVRLAQLTNAVQRLSASRENAAHIGTMEEGKELMVPLTSSIYVPGKLKNTSKVLIDIGTGFFVEKSPKAAEIHFARRAGLLKEEQDKSTQIHTQKRQQLEAVNAVLQRKTSEMAGASSKPQR